MLRVDTRLKKAQNGLIEEESKAQISTESNSKIINEHSRESDEDTKVNSSGIPSRYGNRQIIEAERKLQEFKGNKLKLEGGKEREIDNISYIENYFPFKFDPLEFLTFFDLNITETKADIETMPKEALKQILDSFIRQKTQQD